MSSRQPRPSYASSPYSSPRPSVARQLYVASPFPGVSTPMGMVGTEAQPFFENETRIQSIEDIIPSGTAEDYAFKISTDAVARQTFMNRVARAGPDGCAAFSEFDTGAKELQRKMDCKRKQEEDRQKRIEREFEDFKKRLERELEDCKSQQLIVAQAAPPFALAVEGVRSEIHSWTNGLVPGQKITHSWLKASLTAKGIDVVVATVDIIARNTGCGTWDDIQGRGIDELYAVLEILRSGHFIISKEFEYSLAGYKSVNVINGSFARDQVIGSMRHSKESLEGLVGIYLRRIPREMYGCVFVPQLRRDGGALPCWTERGATHHSQSMNQAASAARGTGNAYAAPPENVNSNQPSSGAGFAFAAHSESANSNQHQSAASCTFSAAPESANSNQPSSGAVITFAAPPENANSNQPSSAAGFNFAAPSAGATPNEPNGGGVNQAQFASFNPPTEQPIFNFSGNCYDEDTTMK